MVKLLKIAIVVFCVIGAPLIALGNEFVAIPGGTFDSVIPEDENDNSIDVANFFIQQAPVTQGEFLRFVLENPQWQRGNAVDLFVDDQYLAGWAGPISLGPKANMNQPVLQVSWFAAGAYCSAQNARLPTWYEWEFVAAASDDSPDGRNDEQWRQEILSWYAQSKSVNMKGVRSRQPNYYDVYDMHGLVWEWTSDFNSVLISGESRQDVDTERNLFCGSGSVNATNLMDYAAFMRYAFRGSIKANYSIQTQGFRCAKSLKQ